MNDEKSMCIYRKVADEELDALGQPVVGHRQTVRFVQVAAALAHYGLASSFLHFAFCFCLFLIVCLFVSRFTFESTMFITTERDGNKDDVDREHGTHNCTFIRIMRKSKKRKKSCYFLATTKQRRYFLARNSNRR